MDSTLVSYIDVARERYTDQFKESVNIDSVMQIWLQGYQELQQEALDLVNINDIETASGAQMDVIGDIVGQPRELVDVSTTGYFGFQSDNGAKKFGSVDNSEGGLYFSKQQGGDSGSIQLSDGIYRAFIQNKIVSNNSQATPEDVIKAAKLLFSVKTVELIENSGGAASFTLFIGRPWNDPEESSYVGLDETVIAERLLPRPAGVRIEYADVGIQAPLNAVDKWVAASDRLYQVANVILPFYMGSDE